MERDLNRELRSVDIDVRRVANDIESGVQQGVDGAGRSFTGLNTKAKASLGEVGEEAARAGDAIGAGVTKGTDRARNSLGQFVSTGKKSSSAFTKSFAGVEISLGGIGKAAGKAFAVGLAGAAIAQTLQTTAALVVALAPAVGALGALGPAFIGAQIAAGTFQLAMMGVADAVGAGLTGDTEAFNEALKQMPVTAQAALKEIVGLKDNILAVRTVVQGNFFGPLVGQLKPLGEAYLPMVANQLGLISQGFGKAGAAAAKFLMLPSSVQAVNNSLTNTRTAVNNISAGVPGLIQAFLPLWEVGSSFLPGLTAEFGKVTEKLATFLVNAQKSGQLKEFISAGLEVLKQLGSVIGDVGSILMSFFQAASAGGGDLLSVIGQAVGQFAKFLDSAEGMSALSGVFQVLGQVAGLFGQALGVVLPVVGQLVSVLAGALQPVLPVISSLIQQMAPVLAQVGQAIGAILAPAIGILAQLLATLVPALLPIVQILISQLLPVINALMPVIAQLGQTIATVLVSALTALMPVFTQLLPVLSQLLVAVLVPMVPVIAQIGQLFVALMPALTPVIALFVQLLVMALKPLLVTAPWVVQAIGFIIKIITALATPLAQAIGWVANFLTELLKTRTVKDNVVMAFNAIKSATTTVFTAVKNHIVAMWNSIKSATSTVWGFIKNFITTQVTAVKTVLRGIGAAIDAVVGFFNRMKNNVSSALNTMKSAVNTAKSTIVGYFGGMVTGATNKINTLLSNLRGIGGKIKSAVGNLAGLLVGAGRNVIQGLINGISQKLGALRDKAASAAATIRNLFPFSPAKEGPLSGKGSPDRAGVKIATMIAAGMDRRIPEVRDAALRMAAAAGPASGHGKTRKQIVAEAIAKHERDKANWIAEKQREAGVLPTVGGAADAGMSEASYVFQAGSIVLNFHGPFPGADRAYEAGRAAGQGLVSAFAGRDVRTTVRTI